LALATEVKWTKAVEMITAQQKLLEGSSTPELDASITNCYAEVNGEKQNLDSTAPLAVPTALSIFGMAGTDSVRFDSLRFKECLSLIPFSDELLEGKGGQYNCTSLFNAILHSNIAAAKQLLEQGVDVFTTALGDSRGAKKGYSIFHEACEKGDINWLDLLLVHHVLEEQPVGNVANKVSTWEINRDNPEETVINVTENIFTQSTKRVVRTKIVRKKSAIIVRELRDNNGNTPLHIACEKNFIEGIELLLYRQGTPSLLTSVLACSLHCFFFTY